MTLYVTCLVSSPSSFALIRSSDAQSFQNEEIDVNKKAAHIG